MTKGIFCVLVCLLMIVSAIVPVSATTVSENKNCVEVTCQVITLTGIRQEVRSIPKLQLEKIKELVNTVDALLERPSSVSRIREAISALTTELTQVGLLSQHVGIDNLINSMVNNYFQTGQFTSRTHQVIAGGDQENAFCFVMGTSNNKTGSWLWRMQFVLAPYIFAKTILYDLFGIENDYKIGPLMQLIFYRPRIMIPLGSWFTYSVNASLVTIGISGIHRIKDQGTYGAYSINSIGFLGIAVGSPIGGFILGSSLYSDMGFNPLPE